VTRFARYWRCALQVNTDRYASDYRGVADSPSPQDYAADLVKHCKAAGIEVVGFADHGNSSQSRVARGLLTANGITVFPGFEVETSEKVHWVCLFSEQTSEQELERYLARLHHTDPAKMTGPSTLSGNNLLAEVNELGGFCYAAHVTSDKGILKHKFNNLWIAPTLSAAQISR